jgi:hypothetical protein
MTPPTDPERYKNHRFPGEIISHGVWLYEGERQQPCVSGVTTTSKESQPPC